jgi:DNA-binding HxlR family transcriptional regulator
MRQNDDYITVACEIISGKWTLLVIGALRHGKVRYSVIQKAIPDITQRALTMALQKLERYGLVVRTSYSTIPPQVEYELTPFGLELLHLSDALADWVKKHADEIKQAQNAYDRQTRS